MILQNYSFHSPIWDKNTSDLCPPDEFVHKLLGLEGHQIVDLLPGMRRALLKGIYDCQVRIGQRCFARSDAVNEFVHGYGLYY